MYKIIAENLKGLHSRLCLNLQISKDKVRSKFVRHVKRLNILYISIPTDEFTFHIEIHDCFFNLFRQQTKIFHLNPKKVQKPHIFSQFKRDVDTNVFKSGSIYLP